MLIIFNMFIPKIHHAVLQYVLTCMMSIMTNNITMIIITHKIYVIYLLQKLV